MRIEPIDKRKQNKRAHLSPVFLQQHRLLSFNYSSIPKCVLEFPTTSQIFQSTNIKNINLKRI